MPSISPDQLMQRMSDAGLMDARQIESLRAEIGTHELGIDALKGILLRKELLTNYQMDRLEKGEKGGYFYGDYKVLYLVGTGTFARVYRAVNKLTGRIVCVVAESNTGTPDAWRSIVVFSRPSPSTFGERPVAASTYSKCSVNSMPSLPGYALLGGVPT